MNKKWIGFTLGLVLVFLVIRTLYTAGTFKSINSHFEGTIKKIYTGMPGTEDLDADYDKGWLFISSSDRWKSRNGVATDDGIFLLSMDSAGSPKKLVTTYTGEFHPHGISYWKTDSASFLFVVNHNKEGSFIELFDFRQDTLFHLRSVSDALMFSPNDVVAVAEDKFYVTNDHGNPKGLLRTAEEYLQIPLSYVLYYNGEGFTKVWTGINYGNGINISKDGGKLFLATTIGRTLLTFDRNRENGSLTLNKSINLGTGLDNISVDGDGTLWIAAHPKMLAFVSHAKDSAKHSPSQILKLTPDNEGGYQVSEIYMNDGGDLSGSSVVLHYKNEMFVGVVFESKLLRATLAP